MDDKTLMLFLQFEANPASSGNSLLCFEPLLLKAKPCEHLSCYTIALFISNGSVPGVDWGERVIKGPSHSVAIPRRGHQCCQTCT